jgi:cation:H+ antiporter
MPFLNQLLQILGGIALLFAGGELFVQGSLALSLLLGIPQLVIGLTVVSLGTSTPELFVSLLSTFRGADDLAVSNVVGSNIFNVLVVLGASALVRPLWVQSLLIRRDVPLLLAVSMAVWGMASAGRLTWQAGLALLAASVINTWWQVNTARQEEDADAEELEEAEAALRAGYGPALLQLITGLVLLVVGSELLVQGASAAARALGVSQTLIGLTIVASGTSMPELVTSMVAAFRGKTDLAVGNVVGSNLLNQLVILGGCALFSGPGGLTVDPQMIQRDLPVMVATALACLPIFWTDGRVSRREGLLLVAFYGLYLILLLHSFPFPDGDPSLRVLILAVVLPLVLVALVVGTASFWQLRRRGQPG